MMNPMTPSKTKPSHTTQPGYDTMKPVVTMAPKSTYQDTPSATTDIWRGIVAARKVTHDNIARRAYEIYIMKGRPSGQSEQHWLQAEQELRSQGSS